MATNANNNSNSNNSNNNDDGDDDDDDDNNNNNNNGLRLDETRSLTHSPSGIILGSLLKKKERKNDSTVNTSKRKNSKFSESIN